MKQHTTAGLALCLTLSLSMACGLSGEEVDIPLPSSAQALEARSTQRDFHGDNGVWFSFALSGSDARSYAQAPLWWMGDGAGTWENSPAERGSPTATWADAPLAGEPLEIAQRYGLAELGRRPVRHAYKRVQGGWRRLVVVDASARRLYYYRETW